MEKKVELFDRLLREHPDRKDESCQYENKRHKQWGGSRTASDEDAGVRGAEHKSTVTGCSR